MIGKALAACLSYQARSWKQLVRRDPMTPQELRWESLCNFKSRAVVHLSGVNVASHRWTPSFKDEMRRSRIETTSRLAFALAQLQQIPEVMLVASAIGFYGSRGDQLLAEQSDAGTGFLAELCQEWEAAAAPAREAGIRVVHLRFGVVLGGSEGRVEGALARLLPIFRMGLGGPIAGGSQWMSWITLHDLVRAVLFAADNPNLAGPLNVVTPIPVTNAEFTHTLATALHRPAMLPVPAFALRVALGEMADETLLASTRVVPQRLAEAGFRFEAPVLSVALDQMFGV